MLASPTRWFKGAALLGAALLASAAPPPPHPSPYLSNPPLAHTGGFGEPTCQACHSDAQLDTPDATVTVDGFPDRYDPGGRYLITISIAGAGQVRGGFQAAVRFAEGPRRGLQAGRLEPSDEHTRVRVDTLTSVQYAHHTEDGAEPVGGAGAEPVGVAGAEPVGDERATWVVRWTAPEDALAVVLHVAANSANGDNSPFGDLIQTAERRSEGVGARARPGTDR